MIIEALLIGAFVGIVVGSLGAGGGILSVPILVSVSYTHLTLPTIA